MCPLWGDIYKNFDLVKQKFTFRLTHQASHAKIPHSTALLDLQSEPVKQLRPFFVCRCRMSKIIERV